MTEDINIRNIIMLNIYRTDYLASRLSTVQQVIVDQLFSRTILVGKESVRISYTDLSRLTGISFVTISKAMKGLIKDKLVKITGNYRPRIANEYSLNLEIPGNLQAWFSAQRDPYGTLARLSGEEEEQDWELTTEGEAILNSIKDSMTYSEKELYRKKAQEELVLQGKEITDTNIDNKITEILLRSFSDEKKKRYCRKPATGK